MKEQQGYGRNQNLLFGSWVKDKDRGKLLSRLETYSSKQRGLEYRSIRTLSSGEEQFFHSLRSTAADKLQGLNIGNPQNLLPTLEQLDIREDDKDESRSYGFAPAEGQYVQIIVSPNRPIGTTDVAHSYYHEASHFIAKRVITPYNANREVTIIAPGIEENPEMQKKWEDLLARSRAPASVVAIGFDSKYGMFKRGIYGESFADLFSLYCLDQDLTLPTGYPDQVAFTIALLNSFAQRTNSEPLDAFKNLFRAHILRDFSMQRELVSAFGKDMVRGMNNLEQNLSRTSQDPVEVSEMQEVAKRGLFLNDFTELKEILHNGGTISLPGMSGNFEVSQN